jgi:hypothetical protein
MQDRAAMSTNPTSQPDELPADIRERAFSDFGPSAGAEIYHHLLERIPDGLPNGTRPRHLRCILYLARGDRARLETYIQMCLEDTRDVMLAAEYEKTETANPTRKRDFARPFENAELPQRKKPQN